jgi:hypothetical protein
VFHLLKRCLTVSLERNQTELFPVDSIFFKYIFYLKKGIMFCLESQKITKAQSLQNCGTQLKQKNGAMTLSIVTYLLHSAYMTLSMTMLCYYAECPYAECHYAECHFAECHYAACHYAELSVILLCVILLSVILLSVIMLSVIILRVIMLSVIMLSVIMLSVIMLSVIMLSVVVPKNIY